LALFLLAGLRDSYAQETPAPASTTIEVNLGEDVVITLEANHSTGFSWQLAQPLEKDILEFTESQYISSNTGLLGAGGKEVWTLKTLQRGKTEVALKYAQPWEKDKPPAKEVQFVIIIK
jgi:inhibitor of cysteine peptidase